LQDDVGVHAATKSRQDEIDAAHDAVEAIEKQKTAAEYRRDYYRGLATQRLNPSESEQLTMRNVASELQIAAGGLDLLAALLHLVPQLGAPTALKYGGLELGHSSTSWSGVLRDRAGVAEASGAAAGLRGGFDRRVEGWEHQVELAKHDISVLDKQLEAAKVREQIAAASQVIHLRTMEQEEVVFDFLDARFSSLGLYTHLASSMQRLYRDAYNGAFAMARLAEQAYRFERNDEDAQLIGASHWEASRAGLLAGDRLMVDLLNLERRYVETNYRTLELDQAFSLTQIDPAALIELRETGTCEFDLPEIFFNLFYPSHYRRRIVAARLTIPSITGPYVNVSATLTLLGSWIRSEPRLDAPLLPVPRRRSVSIATSTAQADSGVFEVNFRDDRLMPFWGQGAVSRWRLTLPRTFRQFDYQTINDALLTLSYTAEADEAFGAQVEADNSAQQGSINAFLTGRSLARVLSLRQDFSAAFHQLLHHPVGTPVEIEITDEYFPAFLTGQNLVVVRAVLGLKARPGQSIAGLTLAVRDTPFNVFAADAQLGSLPATNLGAVFGAGVLGRHQFRVVAAGALAPDAPIPGDQSAIDDGKLLDVILFVEYRVA